VRAVVLLALVVAGCSGKTSTGGTAGSSGNGGTGGSGGSSAFSCPASPPGDGSPCTPPPASTSPGISADSAHCSWGSDPRAACRTTALCTDKKIWSVTKPTSPGCSTPPLPSACPAAPATVGSTCSDKTLSCWYASGTNCWCSDCKGGTEYPICQTIDPPQWACHAPPSGCPTKLPQAGSACSTPGLDCGPDCNLSVVCESGRWVWKQGNCPICASPDTPIETPSGERPIASLRAGDLVYSVDHDAIVAVPLARVASTPVFHHFVMRVVLDSGRILEISPGHPTADGRSFGRLQKGSRLDADHHVVSAELVPYHHARTWDILPGSDTGTYFAAGAEVGSTLFHAAPTP